MKRRCRMLLMLLLTALTSAGCAMCNSSWDSAYNAYGGAVPREDRFQGRVGSILSDPTRQYTEPGGYSEVPTERDLYPTDNLDEPRNDEAP